MSRFTAAEIFSLGKLSVGEYCTAYGITERQIEKLFPTVCLQALRIRTGIGIIQEKTGIRKAGADLL